MLLHQTTKTLQERQGLLKYCIILLTLYTVGRFPGTLRLRTTAKVTHTAPVTHFPPSTLPLDVDLRPRSPATAEEQPTDRVPCYYADYVNVALGVCPTFYFPTTTEDYFTVLSLFYKKKLRECWIHTEVVHL